MLMRSLNINERLGRKDALAEVYFNLGKVFRERGEVADGNSVLKFARNLFESVGRLDRAGVISDLLGAERPN
jgi:hypothetical protein